MDKTKIIFKFPKEDVELEIDKIVAFRIYWDLKYGKYKQ